MPLRGGALGRPEERQQVEADVGRLVEPEREVLAQPVHQQRPRRDALAVDEVVRLEVGRDGLGEQVGDLVAHGRAARRRHARELAQQERLGAVGGGRVLEHQVEVLLGLLEPRRVHRRRRAAVALGARVGARPAPPLGAHLAGRRGRGGAASAEARQQRAAAEQAEPLVLEAGVGELLADDDGELVRQARRVGRVAREAREELVDEARLRHRERVEVVEDARQEGGEPRERRRVLGRELDERLQRRVHLGLVAAADVRQQTADQLLPVLAVPAVKLAQQQHVERAPQPPRRRVRGAEQLARQLEVRLVVRPQRAAVADDRGLEQLGRELRRGGLGLHELVDLGLVARDARRVQRADQPPVDGAVVGRVLDPLELLEHQARQLATQPQRRLHRVEDERLAPRLARRPGRLAVGAERLDAEAAPQRVDDLLGRVLGHVLQQEADDDRQVGDVGGGHRVGHHLGDLLEHLGAELQAAEAVEHRRRELRVVAQQLAEHVDGRGVLTVLHQVGQHEHHLALQRGLACLRGSADKRRDVSARASHVA